jgi:tetratricopeptide (TPR) repeat protein
MSWLRRDVAGLSISCALLVVAASRASAADAPRPADLDLAKAHFRTGELNYERGAYPDAAKEFEEAYRLSGRAEMLYNMGKSYDGAGDMRGALDAYRRFLATVQTSTDRPFVERRVAELEVLIARISITASVPSTVLLDGVKLGTTPLPAAPIELNPGTHSVEIAAEGYATFRRSLTLARAEVARVDAQMVSLVKVIHVETRAKPVPVYKRWYLWAGVGAVVVTGVALGAVFGVRKANEIDGPSLQLPRTTVPGQP